MPCSLHSFFQNSAPIYSGGTAAKWGPAAADLVMQARRGAEQGAAAAAVAAGGAGTAAHRRGSPWPLLQAGASDQGSSGTMPQPMTAPSAPSRSAPSLLTTLPPIGPRTWLPHWPTWRVTISRGMVVSCPLHTPALTTTRLLEQSRGSSRSGVLSV
jgi:hypothetical protein